jgi:hypothetical protein
MNDANDRPSSQDKRALASLLEWTRRSFLKYVGGAAAAGVVPRALEGCAEPVEPARPQVTDEEASPFSVGPTGESISASYVVARASDGLDMQMDLMNLQVQNGQLFRISSQWPSYVVLRTHPQHTSECVASMHSFGAFPRPEEYSAVPAFSSGPSRLVFALPASFTGVPFKLDAILALLSTCPVNVAANAISDAAVTPSTIPPAAAVSKQAPDPTVTAIELPFRLQISPNEQSFFVHSNPPQTLPSSGRVELANSRLAVLGANGAPDEVTRTNRTIRALFTRDWPTPTNPTPPPPNPFVNAPYGIDALPFFIRQNIVQQSGVFDPTGMIVPTSVAVDALMLTPYGGTLQAKGQWPATTQSPLLLWKHETSIGRDDFVQATLLGYVLPFGLRAIVTMTVKRALTADVNPFVPLMATWVLHLVDTDAEFSDFGGLPMVGHRAMPFRRVTALATSFVIDAPDPTKQAPNPNYQAPLSDVPQPMSAALWFPVTNGGAPVMLPMTAVDRRGKLVKFTIPLFWSASDDNSLPVGVGHFNGYAPPAAPGALASTPTTANLVALNRQRLALAPSTKDHTTIEADWLSFQVTALKLNGPNGGYTFFPSVTSMSGVAEATRALGTAGDQPILMNYDKSYAPPPASIAVSNATQPSLPGESTAADGVTVLPSPTQVLVSFTGTVSSTFKSSKAAGGLAMPNATFGAIGMVTGLANGPQDILPAPGTTQPPTPTWSQLLGGAKLFGEIDLGDLAAACGLGKAPRFIAEAYTTVERYAAEIELLVDPDHGLLVQLAGALASAGTQVANDVQALTDASKRVTNALQNLAGADANAIGAIASDVVSLASKVQVGSPIDAALAALRAPYSGVSRAARAQLAKAAAAVKAGGPAIQAALLAMQAGVEIARDQKAKIDWCVPIGYGNAVPSSSVPLLTMGSLDASNNQIPATLTLQVELNGKAPNASQALNLFCSLDNFTLNFPPIDSPWLRLHFDRIFFRQQPGQKTEIDVVFGGIDFLQCLQWLEVIQSLIPSDGFSDPPHVDVTEDGIDAGISCGLPNVCAGMLAFENMKLSADLNVPFIGKAITFSFSFCDRDHPFTVSVAFLGGGGYFTLTMASTGGSAAIQHLEGSFSVCANLAFDVVVASGSLSARAGVTVSYDVDDNGRGSVSLTAFVDLRGALDILGLIQASIEAYLGLTYDFGTNSLTGECKLILSIELFGLSKSITLDFKQTFAGSSSGPSSQDRWHDESPTAPTALPMPSPSFTDLFTDPNPVAGQPPLQTRWVDYCISFF